MTVAMVVLYQRCIPPKGQTMRRYEGQLSVKRQRSGLLTRIVVVLNESLLYGPKNHLGYADTIICHYIPSLHLS